jgi:hypothetical protein
MSSIFCVLDFLAWLSRAFREFRGMYQRRNAAAMRAEESFYRPSLASALLAMALTIFLAWSGMARADDFTPRPSTEVQLPETAQLPDSVHGPGTDRVPPGLACTDEMDLSPEHGQTSPFATGSVAWRAGKALARPIANDGCPLRKAHIDRA